MPPGPQLGFDGKTLIHPGQVEPCNQAFSPVCRGGRARPPRDRGLRGGRARRAGVVTVDGRMIENLHVATARRVLALAGAEPARRSEALGGRAAAGGPTR